jgi:hypothetical protein
VTAVADRPRSLFLAQRVAARPVWWRLLHEAVLLGGLWMVYTVGRGLAGKHVGSAYGHATDVWRLERDLRLPNEASLQRWTLDHTWLIHAANAYYKYEHWLALGAVALWLLLARPERYPWFRAVIVLTTALALVGHFAYPLMPPRMRPDFGFVDTGLEFGNSVYGPDYANHGLVNQYAAMPSMHVGWAVCFALTVIVVARSRWRWLVAVYPAVTFSVVVVTGNHYWLDGIVGIALLALAVWAVRVMPGAPRAADTPSGRGDSRPSGVEPAGAR